jgi:acyl-CoA synthetase (AMP-forming)/AMP-acid ligase II
LLQICRRIAETLTTEHDVPVQAVVLLKPGSLPKTSSGKLMRQACRLAYAHGRMPFSGPRRVMVAMGDTLDLQDAAAS